MNEFFYYSVWSHYIGKQGDIKLIDFVQKCCFSQLRGGHVTGVTALKFIPGTRFLLSMNISHLFLFANSRLNLSNI
jgi:hypothetical protein